MKTEQIEKISRFLKISREAEKFDSFIKWEASLHPKDKEFIRSHDLYELAFYNPKRIVGKHLFPLTEEEKKSNCSFSEILNSKDRPAVPSLSCLDAHAMWYWFLFRKKLLPRKSQKEFLDSFQDLYNSFSIEEIVQITQSSEGFLAFYFRNKYLESQNFCSAVNLVLLVLLFLQLICIGVVWVM